LKSGKWVSLDDVTPKAARQGDAHAGVILCIAPTAFINRSESLSEPNLIQVFGGKQSLSKRITG
jgi:hypothetical protein